MLDPKYQALVDDTQARWGSLKSHEILWLSESRRIFLYNIDGTFYKEFQSLNKLSTELGGKFSFKFHKTHKGYIVLDEYVEKLSEEQIESFLRHKTSKAIIQYDKDNNEIKKWINVNQAGEKLGIPRTTLVNYMKRPDLSLKAKGYYFKYIKN